MKSLLTIIASILLSSAALAESSTAAGAGQEFRFILNDIIGESQYTIDGMDNLTLQFYCPTYNNVSIVSKNDGKKVADMSATNCAEVKNYIALSLISGAKPFAVFNPIESRFVRWGVTNAREGVCRY